MTSNFSTIDAQDGVSRLAQIDFRETVSFEPSIQEDNKPVDIPSLPPITRDGYRLNSRGFRILAGIHREIDPQIQAQRTLLYED